MIFVPHQYQLEAVDFLARNFYAALFADPGLGKTGIILSLIDRLYFSKQHPCPVLIIAPKRVVQTVWPGEIQKFFKSFGYLDYQILHGPEKEKNLQKQADIYLLNAENIFWALGKRKFRTLIIDESSKFKNYRAKRFEALKPLLKTFERRYILTGTPAPNSLLDLFPQQYIVDEGQALGKYITHYRSRYFNETSYRNFSEWNPKKGADRAIRSKLAPTTMRLDQKDHLDLPDIVYNNISVVLPPKAQKLYKSLESELFAELDKTALLIASAAQLYGLCCQLANGRMYEPGKLGGGGTKKILKIHSEKIEALKDLVEELQGKPVLIAYHYKHDLAQLQEAFGQTPCLGEESSQVAPRIVANWNRGQIPILLGHPMSMAHGLNLQGGGNDIVWLAPPDNLENYLQFNQRIWRQGIKQQVRIHHLVAENTVDIAKLKRLKLKNENQMSILDALKRYRKEN